MAFDFPLSPYFKFSINFLFLSKIKIQDPSPSLSITFTTFNPRDNLSKIHLREYWDIQGRTVSCVSINWKEKILLGISFQPIQDRLVGQFTSDLRDGRGSASQRQTHLERSQWSQRQTPTLVSQAPQRQKHRNSKMPSSQVTSETDAAMHPSGRTHLERSQWSQGQTPTSSGAPAADSSELKNTQFISDFNPSGHTHLERSQ